MKKNKKKIRGKYALAYANWLNKYDWELYVTLTYKTPRIMGKTFEKTERELKKHGKRTGKIIGRQKQVYIPLDPHICGEQEAEYQWNRFTKEIEKRLPKGQQVEYVRVTQPHRWRYMKHHHALLKNVGVVYPKVLESWCNKYIGKSRIERYDRKKNARFYICRYINHPNCDLKIELNPVSTRSQNHSAKKKQHKHLRGKARREYKKRQKKLRKAG